MRSIPVTARPTRPATLLAAGLALAAANGALAQECRLSVQTSSPVLIGDQTASVSVFAYMPRPPEPNVPYAFASADFDVFASHPAWTYASAGVIADEGVIGISVSQPHAPQSGIYANPANPYRLWSGVFTPMSDGPALVDLIVDPRNFSVYPSKLTSSSVQCDAAAGRNFLFVNPLSVGSGWLTAPGEGTEVRVSDDVIVDGRIITGENWDSASVGLLPTSQKLRASESRVELYGEPVTFTATVQVNYDRPGVVGDMTISFVGLENGSGHAVGANFAMCDGSVRFIAYEGFLGGVSVAAGDLNGDGANGAPGLVLSALPQTIGGHLGNDVLIGGRGGDNAPGGAGRDVLIGGAGDDVLVGGQTSHSASAGGFIVTFDRPVDAVVRGPDGRPRTITVDRVEVQGIKEAAARISSSNNLKQIGLGCHNFEASGVQGMSIRPTQPR